jgi:putative transposase
MRLIDQQYLQIPFFGSRQMTAWLRQQQHSVNRKRIQRLMQKMGLQEAVPGPVLIRVNLILNIRFIPIC